MKTPSVTTTKDRSPVFAKMALREMARFVSVNCTLFQSWSLCSCWYHSIDWPIDGLIDRSIDGRTDGWVGGLRDWQSGSPYVRPPDGSIHRSIDWSIGWLVMNAYLMKSLIVLARMDLSRAPVVRVLLQIYSLEQIIYILSFNSSHSCFHTLNNGTIWFR